MQYRKAKELHVKLGDLKTKIPTNANSKCNTAKNDYACKLPIVKADRIVSISEWFQDRDLLTLGRNQTRQHEVDQKSSYREKNARNKSSGDLKLGNLICEKMI